MAGKSHKALVIVESPAKARKISGYLGDKYVVMASMGHVRDLPSGAAEVPAEVKKESWATLAVNVDQNFEPLYVVPKEKKKTVKDLKDALKTCDELIIATDEDREGESIGWHLTQLLGVKGTVKRMVFSEITKDAILLAIKSTRTLDENLVQAQETRRVVDRLFGFRLSPLLWKKIAPGLSAGRVQSVAVRLLVTRELERLAFRKGSYWDLKANLTTQPGATFTAELATIGGKRVAAGRDFDEHTGKLKADVDAMLLNEEQARAIEQRLKTAPWKVSGVETRLQTRKPYAPFTTSTLQQEANRKLNLSARETMQVAQRLYEDGYITYMRTDSVSLSGEAITAARQGVEARYGKEYLSPEPRQYTTKTKAAQEAHEAIRPAGTEMKTAEEHGLGGREALLYAMIWKRTVASQMAEAQLRFQTVTIQAADAEFKATGRHVEFPGFFRAYVEGVDDPEAALDDQEAALPPLTQGDGLNLKQLEALGHETKPPARYTEATLVGKLEAEGVGRPSTYAAIIGTITDRKYARKVGNQLIPSFTAFAVTRLLEHNFPKLVDLQFTAKMEQSLDDIANGEAERLPYLKEFYQGDQGLDQQVIQQESQIDPREACTLELSGLTPKIRVGRYGPYFEVILPEGNVTASIPDDLAPSDITNELAEELIRKKKEGPKSLGVDPTTQTPIYVLTGRFGPYLQLGEMKDDGEKPKRVSLPKHRSPDSITFDEALAYLQLPRAVGTHPDTGKVIKAGVGMYGPYVQHEKTYKSLTKDDDVLTVGLDRAVELLAQARVKAVITPLRELGPHPADQEPVSIFDGKYGPYVKHGKVNATIPKDRPVESVTIVEAVDWLAERAAKAKPTRGRATKKSATPKMKAAAKTTAKKTTKKATKKAMKKAE